MDLTSVGLKCKFSDVSLTWASFTQLDYLNMNGNNLQVCLPAAADALQRLDAPAIACLHLSHSCCDDPERAFVFHQEAIWVVQRQGVYKELIHPLATLSSVSFVCCA